MALPDFLCIGAQKAGTSWLYRVLQEHPQIFMPPIKELHFFDRVGGEDVALRDKHHDLARKLTAKERRKWIFGNKAWVAYLERIVQFDAVSPEWYLETFSWPVRDGVRRGEVTPRYLDLDEGQVAYAREMLGPVKVIVIVRRPLDRQISQLRMAANKGKGENIPQTRQEWMQLYKQLIRREGRGAYSKGIPLWQQACGAENMLVLPYGDLKADPRAFLARIEDFLGIPRLKKYRHLTSQVHVTKKLEVPENVIERARRKAAQEDEFLRTTFGEDFFARTK